jgi:signal transduction histidine kinase
VSAYREQAKVLRELFYTAFALLALGGLGGLWWLYQAIDEYVREKNEAMSALELKTDDLQKARDEAVRANLLKSQFVANISHEIRTPMNGILGLSELLSQSETDEDGMAKHIHDSAMSLMTILNDLLDFSKLEAGRMQLNLVEFSAAALLKDVAEFMSVNFAAKGIVLETSIDEALDKEFIGDRDRIRQVLLNLIHNALKFTSTGGVTITIKVEKYYEDEAFVRFEVTDTGIGINLEAKKKLFEPFVQADMSSTRRHGGTGLGLSISKSLVELMNGSIDCQTEENKGSTFSFVVPLRVKLPSAALESVKSTT